MKYFFTTLVVICMFSVIEAFAQKNTMTIEWLVSGQLPPQPGAVQSLGVAGAVCGIASNMMFVAGGANFPDAMPWQGGKKKYHDQVNVFTKKGDQLVLVPGQTRLPEAVAYTANCITPKGIVYAGGENETGLSNKTFLLRWDTEREQAIVEALPALPVAVTNAAAACIRNTIFVLGGEAMDGASNSAWSLDLDHLEKGWSVLPDLPKPVAYALSVAVDAAHGGALYLLGGRRKTKEGISELYNSVFEFDLMTGSWKELPSLPYSLSAGTGVAVGSGSILLFGGERGFTFSKVEQYLLDISSAKTATEKSSLIELKNELLKHHPGFSKEVLHYDLKTGSVKPIGSIPYDTPVTTRAFWWNGVVCIPSGEIKAGVRSPQILIAKVK